MKTTDRIQNRTVRGFLLGVALMIASVVLGVVRAQQGGVHGDAILILILGVFGLGAFALIRTLAVAERAISAQPKR